MSRNTSASRLARASCVIVATMLLGLILPNNGGAVSADDAKVDTINPGAEINNETAEKRESPDDMVVARVNGSEITMASLLKMMNRISAKDKNGLSVDRAQQLALDRLILQHLAFQKALADGLEADMKNVKAALANLKINLGGEEEYRKFLTKEQVTEEDLRAQIFQSLTLELAYAREVYNKVAIPEEEVVKEYEKEKGRYVTAEKIRVVDVLFLPEETTEASANVAEEVLKKIKDDREQNPWNLSLDGTFIVRTYDIKKDRDEQLYQVARKLDKGQLSEVIRTAGGLHIIKMIEYSPARQMSLAEVRGNIENALRVPAQDRRLQEWEQELRKDAMIEIIWPQLVKNRSEGG